MAKDALKAMDIKQLGRELQRVRKLRRLTQLQAAREIGVTRTTICAIEQGVRRIRAGELIKLAHLYRREVHEFMRPHTEVLTFTDIQREVSRQLSVYLRTGKLPVVEAVEADSP